MDTLFAEGQPDQLHSNFMEKGGAYLHVYAPRMYGTQVLRPYTYQINGNAVDRLVHGGKTMAESLRREDIAMNKDVAGSVAPTGNGTKLDMSQVGELWTFVLQIDLISPWLSGSPTSSARARRRILYTGVCLDEPLSMITMWNGSPTPNESCPLRFTHMTETVIDPQVGAMGASNKVMVRSDLDIVDNGLNGQANSQELYLSTPDKLLSCCDSGSGITTEGVCALSNMQRGVGIISTLKSPLAHLRQLCMGIDQQVHLCESSTGNSVANHMVGPEDIFDVDNFKEGVVGEWSQLSTGLNDVSGNINAGDILMLGEIIRTYPDITIIPYNINHFSPVAEQNGCVDQTKISPKTIYSSMVASSVAALANNFGLSFIDFSYDSRVNQFDDDRKGTFMVRDAALLVEPNDPAAAKDLMAASLNMFRRQVLCDLAPAIKAAQCGDFVMHVHYMVNGETYVDLNFYDWASLANDGIYETTNRIANVTTTSVGTSEQFIHNGSVLDSLIHNVYGRHMTNQFGETAFGHDAGNLINTCAPEGKETLF